MIFIRNGEMVVGLAAYYKHAEFVELVLLVTHRDFQQLGIARNIINRLFLEEKSTIICLAVNNKVNIYQRMGFTLVDRIKSIKFV